MSGHSKWATTKRAKAVVDAKRGAVFTKLANTITIAAREKGGDMETNPSLRAIVEKAKGFNMPKDNIERAIKKGTGELAGDVVEELYYEAVLPNNGQIIIKCLTDNKNRSAASVRHAVSKAGGSLGSVMWNFEQKGVISILKEELENKKVNLEGLELELIEANIDDFKLEDGGLFVFTKFEDLQKIKSIIDAKGIEIDSAEIEYVAKEKNTLSEEDLNKVYTFLEELDDLEDVNDYYLNVEV
ncbi:YebC/PmpR family DNA-binding transcriptional regulator [Candidatus Falkowbacteria bacterium HGW-Falkowbacteria-1]|jgi:YebC/PmpR family DNA-binding regulatory protein|uniref:Probable transcriptional regulatory protein CVU82_03740 n=1 Tax=Candidatus Falkowbacteria bacterium HGW-Falkowbacteria-1 TaxID=2013768 RepID=A0A2N2E8W4_9BACT|nr:MAG: YebC/PmpR family DNA-binding transcriptional regulator [Candidatus Falkowbacteria bacterium HGW-Falkowbacteria-1]